MFGSPIFTPGFLFLLSPPFPCLNSTGSRHSLMFCNLSGCVAPHISCRASRPVISFFEETESHRSGITCSGSPRSRTRLLILCLLAFQGVCHSLDPRDATTQTQVMAGWNLNSKNVVGYYFYFFIPDEGLIKIDQPICSMGQCSYISGPKNARDVKQSKTGKAKQETAHQTLDCV